MNSGYEIDSWDLKDHWGITVEKIEGLHSFYNRKGDTYYSWPDSDGDEAFTNESDIYYDGRNITMFCHIYAATYDAMDTAIRQFNAWLLLEGLRTLAVPYSTRTYDLMYVKGSDMEFHTPKVSGGQFYGSFWVQFREPDPPKRIV